MKISIYPIVTVLLFTLLLTLPNSETFAGGKKPKLPRDQVVGEWTITATGIKAADGADLSKLSGTFKLSIAKESAKTDNQEVTGSVFGLDITQSHVLSVSDSEIEFSTSYVADGKSHEIHWQGKFDQKTDPKSGKVTVNMNNIASGTFMCDALGSGTFTATLSGKAKGGGDGGKKKK